MTGLDNGGGYCEWGSPGLGARLPTWELSGGGADWATLDLADWKRLELSAMLKGRGLPAWQWLGWGSQEEREVGRRSPGPGARGYRLADLEVQRKAVGELRWRPWDSG